ncbi:TlpA disulfide reductase family protein [Mucilaginibacter sp. PPCGB 2223]|uniref:TlpA family protein disulfide reductase n=1 Tax=Mucilaginibacter sp. PPCGB 2223 TaxID=1886027 RepID=UPI001586F38D|nr:TlpA disulfide reductase family protein [Mucilaginibacter sp. PPCGB 2223]
MDTNQVVYDENNKPLRYYQYQKLLNTGSYTIRIDGMPTDADAKRYLKKLTAEERAQRFERMRSFYVNKSPLLQENQELDIKPLLDDAATKQELDNKVIVLIFWSVECPPCTESFAALNDYFKEIDNPDKIIILALTRDKDLTVAAKMKSKPLEHTRLINNAGKIIDAYQNRQLPAFVVTDKNHIIKFSLVNQVPEFKIAIKTALAE